MDHRSYMARLDTQHYQVSSRYGKLHMENFPYQIDEYESHWAVCGMEGMTID